MEQALGDTDLLKKKKEEDEHDMTKILNPFFRKLPLSIYMYFY